MKIEEEGKRQKDESTRMKKTMTKEILVLSDKFVLV
jgi:hypothetical protein